MAKYQAYLIIKTGYEGIDKLSYLVFTKEDAIQKKKIAIANEKREYRKRIRDSKKFEKDNTYIKDTEELCERLIEKCPDFFCVQGYDGKKWECVCNKLKVPPSKFMLR